MRIHGIVMLGLILPLTTVGGEIKGLVRAEGKPGTDDVLRREKYTSKKFRFVERMDYDSLRDFVIYIDQELPFEQAEPPPRQQVVAHKDASFVPHVLPVLKGTTVEWPNVDDIHHNAFSFSESNPFDLGLYKDEVKSVTFHGPGRVDVFCSIHTTMHCIVLVLENPYFATPNKSGRYTIKNVPAGTYRVRAWHERLPSLVKEVTVPAEGSVEVDFKLSVSGLPQY